MCYTDFMFDTEPDKPLEVKFFDGHYKQFGTLTAVEETNHFVEITNDKGQSKYKSKKYPSWRSTMEKAEQHIGTKVVTRTSINSGGWSADQYFNDLVFDGGLLEIPEDAGEEATKVILGERLSKRHFDYANAQKEDKYLSTEEDYKQRIEELQADLQQMVDEREQLTPKERAELDDAIKDVADAWHDFTTHPDRTFGIIGAGYSKKPGHIDKVFALRYGIDVTKRKRIRVQIVKRLETNYVGCYLPEYDNQPIVAALKKSSHRDANNQWIIASVKYLDKSCFKIEKRYAPNGGKDITKPIEWFLETHEKIMSEANSK